MICLSMGTKEMCLPFLLTRYLNKPIHALSSDAMHAWDEMPINIYLTVSLLSFRFLIWLLDFFWGFSCLYCFGLCDDSKSWLCGYFLECRPMCLTTYSLISASLYT